jgi:murein DD-endopeptidase MepM/ murein hydrolase activator NlpD
VAGSVRRVAERVKGLILDWFPERQILIRGTGSVSATHLKTSHQCAVAAGVALLVVWSVASPLAFLAFWHGQAAASHRASTLQADLAGTTTDLGAAKAQNAALAATSGAAVAQAQQFTATAAQQIDALDAQTKATIATVDGIIAATGIDPKRVARPQAALAPDHTAALRDDLAHLQKLSVFLGKMPLAPPVARMTMSSPFGMRPDPWTGAPEFHVGIDLRGPENTPVYATAPGKVSFAGCETGYGEIVELDHGYGLSTRYSHLNRILVHPGQVVALHQLIGLMGNTGWSTGPHLLYETRLDGAPQNPLNFLKVSENEVQD